MQRKPLEVVYKKSYSEKFHNIHRKTHVLESLFDKVAGLKVLLHTNFHEALQTAASDMDTFH